MTPIRVGMLAVLIAICPNALSQESITIRIEDSGVGTSVPSKVSYLLGNDIEFSISRDIERESLSEVCFDVSSASYCEYFEVSYIVDVMPQYNCNDVDDSVSCVVQFYRDGRVVAGYYYYNENIYSSFGDFGAALSGSRD